MALTPEDFKIKFKEFAAIDDARIQLAIDEAELEVSVDKWSTMYNRGLGYLAAHILKIDLAIEGGDSNLDGLSPLSTKTIGDVSVSLGAYLAVNPDAETLNLSPYGREYFRLRGLISFGGLALGE